MSIVKVNPMLFGTCRLCLEDIGQYIIVPKIQERIKYCFGIDVEAFDGLPQLLCNACEGILKKFYETKKKFVHKQNDLLNKVDTKNAEKQHLQDSNVLRQNDSTNGLSKPPTAKKKQIVLSFSCSRLDQTPQCTVSQNKNDKKNSVSWSSDYKKEFACRLCNYRGSKKQNILKHTRTWHKSLTVKHQNVLKNNCKIKLDKLDKMPNITGSAEIVVISNEKIVQDINCKSYFIIYTRKALNRVLEKNDKSDISDDECMVKKKRKISDDTLKMGIEDQQNFIKTNDVANEIINGDCIKIDDSSDNASEKNCNNRQEKTILSTKMKKTVPNVTTQDHSSKIQNIISICQNKYKKNIDLHKMHNTQTNDPAQSKSQLKHKVLSIGRKIVNKQGFNCTGLLRYMEHRNLEIVWTPNTSNFNTDSNYVRIMTKLNGNVVDEDDLGWRILPVQNVAETLSNDSPLPKISQVFYSDNNAYWKMDTKNKLLNKNPVDNPKQMPRKIIPIEKHIELVPTNVTCPKSKEQTAEPTASSERINSCKPDVCATTAVSQESCIDKQNPRTENNIDTIPPQNNIDNDTELSTGRIKVKPLAELLSKEGLMNSFIVGNPTKSNTVRENIQPNLFTCMVPTSDTNQTGCIVKPINFSGLPTHINLTSANHINITNSSHINVTNPSHINPTSPIPINLTNPIIQPNKAIQTINNAQINYPAQTIYTVQPSLVAPTKDINQIVLLNQSIQLDQPSQVSQKQTNQKSTGNLTSCRPSTQSEYVIMDTIELPAIKTNSPIQYLENLLLIHNIYLLGQSNSLSNLFVCLIRFKVLYKQDTMAEPIVLSLSLFCYKNKFCMKVKNMNQENIDISKISASWQWEIIKVFKGDVANKLLQNARSVNQETYEHAHAFLDLLKRINYTKM